MGVVCAVLVVIFWVVGLIALAGYGYAGYLCGESLYEWLNGPRMASGESCEGNGWLCVPEWMTDVSTRSVSRSPLLPLFT